MNLDILLLLFVDPKTRIWGTIVLLFVFGLGYLGYRLTKGFIGGYLKAEIGNGLKTTMFFIHGLGSLILALMIPNNYLVEIELFRGLYEQSGLWIAASILTLLFMFLLAFGTIFTMMTRKKIKNIENN